MKTMVFLFIILLTSCTSVQPEDNGGYVDSSAVAATIEDRLHNLEVDIYNLKKDTAARNKVELDLQKKYLDIMVTYINPFKQKFVSHDKDSVWQAKQILDLQKKDFDFMATYITPFKQKFVRLEADTVWQAKQISTINNQFSFKVPSALSAAITSGKADSVRVWLEINKLKGASPVTQIPLIQTQIKNMQTMDKNFQASLDNFGTQISVVSKGLYDSTLAIRNLITSVSLFVDTLQFSAKNKVLQFIPLPSILQSLTDVKKDILELKNQIPATIK